MAQLGGSGLRSPGCCSQMVTVWGHLEGFFIHCSGRTQTARAPQATLSLWSLQVAASGQLDRSGTLSSFRSQTSLVQFCLLNPSIFKERGNIFFSLETF